MTVSVVEAEPLCRMPPMGVDMRICMGDRSGFGPSAPSSTRAPSILFSKAEGSNVSLKKLVQLIGWVVIDPCR